LTTSPNHSLHLPQDTAAEKHQSIRFLVRSPTRELMDPSRGANTRE
jgi:hypothetical protein